MTARADAPPSGAGARAGARGIGAGSAARRLARRLLSALWAPFRPGAADAGQLTDRQLADVGLTRSDLPDSRGWRR